MSVAAKPQIVVKSDYDGYFENLVRSWLKRKTEPVRHEVIEITAGPYRSSAVAYVSDGRKLRLDFYSALRTGFGSLSSQDVTDIEKLL